jgi:hypothetical protein
VFAFAALIGYAERRRLSTAGVQEIAARDHKAVIEGSARLGPA